MVKVLSGVEARLGEDWVRAMFHQYTQVRTWASTDITDIKNVVCNQRGEEWGIALSSMGCVRRMVSVGSDRVLWYVWDRRWWTMRWTGRGRVGGSGSARTSARPSSK